MTILLPYPPSLNHYWRKWRNRIVVSQEGREYRARVCGLLAGGGDSIRRPPAGGRIALCVDAFPPDRRRRDLDNLQKALIDSGQHAGLYEDDSQIDLLLVQRGPVMKGGLVRVHIELLPLRVCPLCGGRFPPAVEAN